MNIHTGPDFVASELHYRLESATPTTTSPARSHRRRGLRALLRRLTTPEYRPWPDGDGPTQVS